MWTAYPRLLDGLEELVAQAAVRAESARPAITNDNSADEVWWSQELKIKKGMILGIRGREYACASYLVVRVSLVCESKAGFSMSELTYTVRWFLIWWPFTSCPCDHKHTCDVA